METNEGPSRFNSPLVVTAAVPNVQQPAVIAPQVVYQQPIPLQVGLDPQSQQQINALAQPIQYVVQPQPQQLQTVVVVKKKLEGMTKQQKELFIAQQMMLNGGFCWRMTLIILWSIGLAGSIVQLIMGSLLVDWETSDYWWTDEEYVKEMVFSLLLPGIIGTISAPISIYALTRYNYCLSIFSCIAGGLLLLDGLVIFMFDYGWGIFLTYYLIPFVYFAFIFAFSIVFTQKIAYIKNKGSAGDPNADCCKGCYDCCGCCKYCCKFQAGSGCCQGQGEGCCC